MQSSHSSEETGGSYRSFAAMLDGRKNTISLLENEFMQSCHSTWLPCKLLKMADPSFQFFNAITYVRPHQN